MLGGASKVENVRGGGISLPTGARFISADFPSKPKNKTMEQNQSGCSPGPSWRKPIPHTVAGYRPEYPQVVWPVGYTCH